MFRWWIVIPTVLAALAAMGYGGLVWRWHRAQARFREDVAQRHARGERVLAQDFQAAPIADDHNAADYLTRASAAVKPLDFDTDDAIGAAINSRRALTPEITAVLRKMAADDAEAFALARKARQYPQANWKIEIATPVTKSPQSKYLTQQRRLALALGEAASYRHRTGDDAETIELVRDILGAARALDYDSTVVTHLVAIGLRAMASDKCLRIALDLSVAQDSGHGAAARAVPAGSTQVRALIDELLDETAPTRGIVTGWEFEKMEKQNILIDMATSSNVYMKAACYDEASFIMKMADASCAASMATHWPTAKTLAAAVLPNDDASKSPFPKVTAILAPGSYSIAKNEFHGRAERRIAAIALAMRLYAVDHDGAWPSNLNQLVPAYLKSVPVDPFSSDGQPLGYLPGAKLLLYSVGEDGIDGHGDQTPKHSGATNAYRHWDSADAVFRIGGDDEETPAR